MKRVTEFTECPLCGKTHFLWLTPKRDYYFLKHKYGNALVMIRCWECDLELKIFSSNSKSDNYDIMVGELKKKWAKLKH